jgi:uncharacterized protein YidB (DUF937 family)
MLKTKLYSVVSLLVALSMLVASCAAPKPAGLSDQQVTSMTENILKALDANNYQEFSGDFSDQMNSAFSQEQFTKLRNMLQASSGNYVATNKLSLSNNQDFSVYQITCKYEREDVVVTIIFKVDRSRVEGLFFDSPNLRTTSQ